MSPTRPATTTDDTPVDWDEPTTPDVPDVRSILRECAELPRQVAENTAAVRELRTVVGQTAKKADPYRGIPEQQATGLVAAVYRLSDKLDEHLRSDDDRHTEIMGAVAGQQRWAAVAGAAVKKTEDTVAAMTTKSAAKGAGFGLASVAGLLGAQHLGGLDLSRAGTWLVWGLIAFAALNVVLRVLKRNESAVAAFSPRVAAGVDLLLKVGPDLLDAVPDLVAVVTGRGKDGAP